MAEGCNVLAPCLDILSTELGAGEQLAVDFIFMLTCDDQTVADCLDVFDDLKDSGLGHVGFKDLGVGHGTLARLNARIKDSGAISYMEMVSTTEEACLESARVAIDIGVDRLLGGTNAEPILAALDGSGIAYYPFPGRPEGHPTRLRGGPEDIAADCRHLEGLGCAGVDLLAYRALDAQPMALVRAARAALSGTLIVAGSIDTPGRVRALADVGVDAFTIGTAAFEGSFSPRKTTLRAQIDDILAASAAA